MPRISRAILREIVDLQNRDQRLVDSFVAYVNESLEEYISVAEENALDRGYDDWLVWAIRRAIEDRVNAPRAYRAITSWLANESAVDPAREPPARDPEAVGVLFQFALRCLAGFPLTNLEKPLRALLEGADSGTRSREEAEQVGWLCLLNEAGGCQQAQNGRFLREAVRSDRDPDALDTESSNGDVQKQPFGITPFLGVGATKITRELRKLVSKNDRSPFSDIPAYRVLEAGLLATPVDERVRVLMELNLPSGVDEIERLRSRWRPSLGSDGASRWILAAANDKGLLERAFLYLSSQKPLVLSSDAQQVVAAHLIRPSGTMVGHLFHGAMRVALNAQSTALAEHFASGSWSAPGEPDLECRGTGSFLLARAVEKPGGYAKVRQRMISASLGFALEIADAAEVPQIVDDLIEDLRAMLRRASEADEQDSLVRNPSPDALGPSAARRLVEQGAEALTHLLNALLNYASDPERRCGLDRLAYSLLPALSVHKPEVAARLLRALIAENSRRKALRAQRELVHQSHIEAVMRMRATPEISRLRQQMALGARDDACLLTLCKASFEPGCAEGFRDMIAGLVTSRHFGHVQRAQYLARLAGLPLAQLADVPTSIAETSAIPELQWTFERLATRRHEILSRLAEWRVGRAMNDGKIESDVMWRAGYLWVDTATVRDDSEAWHLMRHRLRETLSLRQDELRATLCGVKAPPAWMISLNHREVERRQRHPSLPAESRISSTALT